MHGWEYNLGQSIHLEVLVMTAFKMDKTLLWQFEEWRRGKENPFIVMLSSSVQVQQNVNLQYGTTNQCLIIQCLKHIKQKQLLKIKRGDETGSAVTPQ